ncbi:double-strand break repair protein AddB [Acetobacter ghanensis]|uniref:Double-strand break repair protein AddB n=2 Tax=Acetobacter ghanensis TaxID=431306 RepID=A0ABX0KIN6_9PROT|nr:double-strand break repair protein AddB [Acetobacter ghanensis]NHO39915.1 double-strand break repair protein AddB [Acetobacter ghanensis]GBQ47368.1 nuclease [Acetobacter ghanensis DSM 18895]
MKVATIPAHLPFLDQLAGRWIEASGHDPEAMGEGTIILPGRRAARALTEAFLRRMDGRSMLLPRIMPIGALDETELGLSVCGGADALALPPAVTGMTRLAVLTRLILQADGAFGTRPTLDQAWPLARALAELMDEAEWAGVNLLERLPDAVQESFAEHWQIILKFLEIVTAAWPAWLQSQGLINPVARQVALLASQARLWRTMGEQGQTARLWAAGFTHAMAPTAEALQAILSCPEGKVILPGLDTLMPEDVFATLPDSHPQAGMSHLLAALETRREDVQVWNAPGGEPARAAVLSRIMLPAAALDDWSKPGPVELAHVSRFEAADQQEEAVAISMIMRDAIEQPGHRVALVTPDRGLAARVATELERWGILADDSAGATLADTPVAVLLRLVAQAVDSRFTPVALLSVLKHPLVACGLAPGVCRATARLLERAVLRGPSPVPGFAGLCAAVRDRLEPRREKDRQRITEGETADRPFGPEPLPAFMERLAHCLEPVLGWDEAEGAVQAGVAGTRHQAAVPDLLAALVATVERLARTDEDDAATRLWKGEDGSLLASRLSELMLATDVLPPQPPAVLDGLLTAVLAQERVATRRGNNPQALHPRVLIWGLFEARLQTAETVILGGLSEGVWPPAPDAGPWMSRPMRKRVGLPPPEQAVGQAAHDFFAMAASADHVVLSSARRREGAPVVPARWLTRLDAFLAGWGGSVPEHPVLSWLAQLDQPDGPAMPVAPPRPTPDVSLRPRRLSVTEIETWMRDPYAIYARHILKLDPMPELEEGADASDYGMIVHDALERWVKTYGVSWPADAERKLADMFKACLAEQALRPALQAWWAPRLERIAGWVAQAEEKRRATHGVPQAILTEIAGAVVVPDAPGGPFRLVGRADRVELGAQGRVIVQDYKTGMLPSMRDVLSGWSPQLPLEAAMLLRGGFAAAPGVAEIGGLIYWRLTGGAEPGEEVAVASKDYPDLTDLAEHTWQSLLVRIAAYDNPAQPYLSHPHPGQEPRFADYARLARVPEWNTGRMETDA